MQDYIAIDLLSDTLKRSTQNPIVCFFIINKEHDSDFIKKTSLEFIEQGAWYHFYGQYEPIWHFAFDEADIMVYPDSTEGTVAMTCGYDDLEEFAEEFLYASRFVPKDLLLFYDDDEVYAKFKEQLASIQENDA